MKNKIALIDFLRGFSIFTIVLMHLLKRYLPGSLSKAAAFGGAGVHVFILVSGFGLYLSYLHKPLRYDDFLKKRFGKIYWPYAIMVVIWMLWILASSGNFLWREGLSHLFLYKMFIHELDVSFCYPYWFISTIIQFYICWPLIVRVSRLGSSNNEITSYGLTFSLLISLLWASVVGILGYEDSRPWGSCFLQYLWEFVLGMWIAQKYEYQLSYSGLEKKLYNKTFFEDAKILKWWWLIVGFLVSMLLTAYMGWNGGILKLYNDIPSLVAYLSCLLIIYRIGIKFINKFFIWASGFGYELYLVHSLVYIIIRCELGDKLELPIRLSLSFVVAYCVAWCYNKILKSTIYKK